MGFLFRPHRLTVRTLGFQLSNQSSILCEVTKKRNMKSVNVVRYNFKAGDIVRRCPTGWRYAEKQDNYGKDYGTILKNPSKDSIFARVRWENGHENVYHLGDSVKAPTLIFDNKHLTPDLINRIGHLL